uniref:Transaldolase n=1 Tax=Mycena chlorophos TaxID=658473 RepID=A0ABQ0M685_MYCCL|nr:transaldolase [Mycena chlorophos]
MAAPSALQALRAFGVRVASDTAEYEQIREFASDGHLTDATTNPSLVFAAVSKPQYAHLVDDAVEYARRRGGSEVVAMDRLVALVSAQIASIIPGRVSVSADPRLAYNTDALIAKAHSLIRNMNELGVPSLRILIKIPATYEGILAAQQLERETDEAIHTNMTLVFGRVQAEACAQAGVALGVPTSRILIKIPATYEGILAAQQLERETDQAIHTNMTLVFGRVQAEACAQAGVAVISPFIGRVKDFWDAVGVTAPTTEVAKHPGIKLVRTIRGSYDAQGVRTEILAAGFRVPEEVIELGAGGREAGPDAVTIPPSLIAPLLARQQKQPRRNIPVHVESHPTQYFGAGVEDGAELYARDIAAEQIAAFKVPEGLAKFSVDAQAMEDMLKRRLEAL